MAADPNPTLRAELTAALAVIEPQIRGLEALIKFPQISPDTASAILNVIDIRVRRRRLIATALASLDLVVEAEAALEMDGYPALGAIPVLASIEEEILQDLMDLEAAVGALTPAHAETGNFNPERSINA